MKIRAKFPFALFPSSNDTYVHSSILPSWENRIPEKVFQRGKGETFSCTNACCSHCCKLNVSGELARDFSTFFRFHEGSFIRTTLAKSERSDLFQPKRSKEIEHMSYAIKSYCKITLLMYCNIAYIFREQ